MVTLGELAEKLKISRNTLIKISNKLTKLGYVDATRGPSGGLRLGQEAGRETVGAIVRNIEENMHLAECFKDGKIQCTLLKGCVLKICLDEALDAFVSSLDKYTLNDITS